MKYLYLTLLLVLSQNIFAQSNTDSSLLNIESEGFILSLGSENFTNNVYDLPIYINDEYTFINLNLNGTGWKFSKEFNIGGFAELIGIYDYVKFESGNYAKVTGIFGTLFAEMDYYHTNKFYSTYSAGTRFSNSKIEHSRNVLVLGDAGKGSTNYLWGGIGYGKILNTASKTKGENFERILLDEGILSRKLPSQVRAKLFSLIEKRNNRDFISGFRDDSDVEFFENVERLLESSGLIEGKLGAGVTIKLYNSLTNDRYLYYPNFSGFQLQSEMQWQIFNDRYNNLVNFGGIFGTSLFPNANLLFTGFVTLPLNKNSSINGVFNNFKDPFTNYLPLVVDRYKLHNKNYVNNREYYVDFDKEQDYYAGGKLILFYKFNEYAGIRGFASTILNKPQDSAIVNLSNVGAILDYNIFSRLTLNFQIEYTATNLYTPDLYYNLGFLWNIF